MSEQGRISHLVRRAILVLESDCQGARRCLNDVLALLGPEPVEQSVDDPVAGGVFEPGGLARWQARRALTYIDEHLESRLDVPLLAKLVSFSKSHFSRAFKQSLGLPPMTYVKMRRIERAKTLMTSTNQQLTEIALICGFADQSHLNRSFRRVLGESPGRWRRTHVKMTCKPRVVSDGSLRLRAGADVLTLP
ncbi:MAG TPA: AraC family transcriptional regulator [Steroidobacteraceae bacterium]|nr:AraC family transcriptional regulator [Steroidobacteraceae bacterium]